MSETLLTRVPREELSEGARMAWDALNELTGTPTFVMRGELLIPSDASIAKLRHELGERCEAEHLDFVLEPVL